MIALERVSKQFDGRRRVTALIAAGTLICGQATIFSASIAAIPIWR